MPRENTENSRKNKHMTLEERLEIQECLNKGMTFKAIGRRIGKSATTVSREVKQRMQSHHNGFVKQEGICPRLLKAPFVCNGCEKRSRSSCPYLRQIYVAKAAQADYERLLVESRTGVALNREEFYHTEEIVSQAVLKGQHIYHILQTHQLPVSSATVYRHIKSGFYRIGLLDLPRAVKFKPRKKTLAEHVPSGVRKGRSYEDYKVFTDDNPDLPIVEMDTVIGRPGGKVILTLHFVNADCMVGILLENRTSAEASCKFQEFKRSLLKAGFRFGDIAPVLLTDNGGEFSCVSKFENDPQGEPETRLFFCHPRSPNEKPHVEKNHTLFRNIVPSGLSFDDFSQDDVNLIFSHVNSVKRKRFNGKSAFEMFVFYYSLALTSALGLSLIPPSEVIQSPILLHSISHT